MTSVTLLIRRRAYNLAMASDLTHESQIPMESPEPISHRIGTVALDGVEQIGRLLYATANAAAAMVLHMALLRQPDGNSAAVHFSPKDVNPR